MRSTTPQQYSNNTGQSPRDKIPISPTTTNDPSEPNGSLRRRGSFSFLRRSKSRERSVSDGGMPQRKLSKKASKRMREEEMRKMKDSIPPRPPRIPAVPTQPELKPFGGEDSKPSSTSITSNRAAGLYPQRLAQKTSQGATGSAFYQGMPVPPVPPIPPIPGYTPGQGGFFDTGESMANRGRYSYASSAISTINSPRKIRRRKDPAPFKYATCAMYEYSLMKYSILVLGSRGSGKTSFVNFLQSSLILPLSKRRRSAPDEFENPPLASEAAFPNFTSQYVETEVEGERIGVTLWDSEGLQESMVDLQLKEMVNFVESKFEDTFTEESKVARAPGFRDTHIHCAFMLLDPQRLDSNVVIDQKAKQVNGAKAKANSFHKNKPEPIPGGLDQNLDLSVLRALKGKTTVVPIISKADSTTTAHITYLKRAVWESLKQNGLDSLEALEKDDDSVSDTSTEHGDRKDPLDERHEDNDYATNHAKTNETNGMDPDSYSVTSHLDSPSDSDSFTSANFDLAKPGKLSKAAERRSSSPEAPVTSEQHLLPFSIISPDPYEPELVGRRFAWGFADPLNEEHCDFAKLKKTVFTEWRNDLREASRDLWYESWRTSRLDRKSKRHAMSLGVSEVQTKIWAGQNQSRMQSNQPWMQ